MKIKISSILKTIAFLAVLCVCIFATTIVLRNKDSDYKYGDFFDKADQIDVLFIGSSHVINAINPAVLYGEYGITSYNMGGPDEQHINLICLVKEISILIITVLAAKHNSCCKHAHRKHSKECYCFYNA